MAIKFDQIDILRQRLRNVAERSSRGAREQMAKGAEMIAELAKELAPVDEGNLEDAIMFEKEPRQKANERYTFAVYVDEAHAGTRAADVGQYAVIMHESSDYDLGEKSAAKAAANGLPVGRKYLENAADMLEDEIADMVAAHVIQGVGH